MGQFNPLRSAAMGSRAVDRFYEDVRKDAREGKPVAWLLGSLILSPMITSMDIPWVFGDALAAHLAARRIQRKPMEVAEDLGYLLETCSYTRVHMGCALLSDEDRATGPQDWDIPKPDFVIISDQGCTEWYEWGDDVSKRFGVPMFTVHVPCVWEGDGREEVAYTVGQLKEMNTFVEDITHRRQNWDKLTDIISVARQAQLFRDEAQQLCRNVPSPASIFDWATALGAVFNCWGQPESVETYQAMKQEMEERVAKGEGAVMGEKYRLAWDGMIVWPMFGHLAKKLAAAGACTVTSAYMWGFFPELMSPDNTLESISRNLTEVWCNRSLDFQIENVTALCQEYGIDGLICHAHYTCRALCGQQLELMDAVTRRLGIPGMVLEADVGDETFYSDAQVDTRLGALLETIDARRSRVR